MNKTARETYTEIYATIRSMHKTTVGGRLESMYCGLLSMQRLLNPNIYRAAMDSYKSAHITIK